MRSCEMVGDTARIAAYAASPRSAGLQGSAKVERLRDRHCLDRQNVARVVDHSQQLVCRRHPHRHEIFLVTRCGDRVDGSRMGPDFVLADEGGGGDLRHHETGVQILHQAREREGALRSKRD